MNISDKIKRYLLSEEAGISDEVLLVTSNIRKEIEAIEPNCQIRVHPSKGYLYKVVECFVNIFGQRVLVRAIVRFAKDKNEAYRIFMSGFGGGEFDYDNEAYRIFMSGFDGGEFDYDNKVIRLKLTKINDGSILWAEAMGTLQHEIEHVYQTNKSGKSFLTNKKNRLIYNKASFIVSNDRNYYRYQIAFAIYSSFKFEISADENTLYRSLSEKGSTFTTQELFEILEQEPLYKWVDDLKGFLKEISSDTELKQDIDKYIKFTYGKNYDWFVKLVNSAISKYTRVFGRVIYKVNKDKQGNVEINVPYKG
jgi:hypothetical protein